MFKRLLRSRAVRRASARLLEAYLRFALRSARWSFAGAEHLPCGEPAIVAFWHECLPLMPMMWWLARERGVPGRAHVLVSRHRDGRLIADVLQRMGAETIQGSSESNRRGRAKRGGGAAALRRLLRVLAAKDYVVVTPDGPRGPARHAAPGVAALAAMSGAAVLPAAACMRPCLRVRSWDRMMLPVPFARGAIVCGPPLRPGGGPVRTDEIADALTSAAERAARRCRE